MLHKFYIHMADMYICFHIAQSPGLSCSDFFRQLGSECCPTQAAHTAQGLLFCAHSLLYKFSLSLFSLSLSLSKTHTHTRTQSLSFSGSLSLSLSLRRPLRQVRSYTLTIFTPTPTHVQLMERFPPDLVDTITIRDEGMLHFPAHLEIFRDLKV